MHQAGGNVLYCHVVKCALQPRLRPLIFTRNFKTTTYSGYDTVPAGGSRFDPVGSALPPSNPHARDIAILGGGLTGLATAFHLNRQLPKAKITIYEKKSRIGGWVDSEVVQVDDGEVLFEWGPRTIRCAAGPAPTSMIELVCELGLTKDLVAIPKSAPAARNRYIYYPDRLVKMPSPFKGSSLAEIFGDVQTILTEPLFRGIHNIIKEPWVSVRNRNVKDESLGDFMSRRFGRELADNLVSAVCHGIFAGDIYKLSARTLQPMLWHLETRDEDDGTGILFELLNDMMNRRKTVPTSSIEYARRMSVSLQTRESYLRRVPNMSIFENLSVYTFKRGLSQLTSALEQHLRENKNITIKESAAVDDVQLVKGRNQLQVWSCNPGKNPVASNYDYVVSTLDPQHMGQLLPSDSTGKPAEGMVQKLAAACKRSSASVNVMVINLYYTNPNLLSVEGFGYLIPRSVPVEQNPERALGVIFGSETSGVRHAMHLPSAPPFYIPSEWDQERSRPVMTAPEATGPYKGPESNAQDTAQGTKLTVMMGGHWWSEWAESDLPSEEQAIEMAQALLKRHLKIEEPPSVAKARLNRHCIPQYPVGYPQDMATIHNVLSSTYQGRLKVAGPWWQGSPGMNDCVRSAKETAWAIRDQADHVTGLQNYMKESWFVAHTTTGQTKIEYSKS